MDGLVASTRMACAGEALTAQEDTVMRVMGGGFVATGNTPMAQTLTLTQENDRHEFKRQDGTDAADGPSAPAPLLGPTIFDVDCLNVFGLSGPLNIRQAPNTEAVRVARVLAGTLLRNGGCEQRPDRTRRAVEFMDASGTQE